MIKHSGCHSIGRFRPFTLALILGAMGFAGSLHAETIKIEALGASIVCGKGVGVAAAWPAQLEGMLRGTGYDVSVGVDCANGDSGGAILKRAGSIAPGTKVVIYNTGGTNNRQGENVSAIASQIESAIRAHGAVPIRAVYKLPPNLLQADGIHPTVEGHMQVAAGLVPRVTAVLGKK
jgi:acyl-CoA thioesterase-1